LVFSCYFGLLPKTSNPNKSLVIFFGIGDHSTTL